MYNGHDDVSNHQPYDCLLNRLFRRWSKKTSKVHVTGLCEGISPVTGEFSAQRTSNVENASIWWRHHVRPLYLRTGGTELLSICPTTEYPPHPNCFSTIEISGNAKGVNFKCHLNIRKHRPWAYILGFIELPYFGPWTVSADIFGWTYLYLYLYLNRRICICICIWIKVEENICICICIWKIQIFVFVFVFVFDKTYLTPALVSEWVSDKFSGPFWPKYVNI